MTAVRAQLLSCKSALLNFWVVTGQAGSSTFQLLLRLLMRQSLGSATVQPSNISQQLYAYKADDKGSSCICLVKYNTL